MKKEIYILFNILFLLSCFFIALSINLLTQKRFETISKKKSILSNVIVLNKEIKNYSEKLSKIKTQIDSKNKIASENDNLKKEINTLDDEITKYQKLNKEIDNKISEYK